MILIFKLDNRDEKNPKLELKDQLQEVCLGEDQPKTI